ncbi:MAG TPA: murein biosynthesis integral membrane protein MurJ [Candidatus Saccharimonadia bacterium]|nr:murein biosynthesis integral membrane protein MurJ [Candidatus Saccharimonadia bacterium]
MVDKAKRLLGRANQHQTVSHAALLISTAYLGSRLLGLLRDRLLVAHFGIGPQLSAYNAAFRLPDLLYTLLVSGAFAVAFIPVLTKHLQKDQQEEAWRVTSSLLTILVLGTIVGAVLIFIFAGPLTTLLTPGFDAQTHALTVHITQIMAVTPVLFAVSSVLGSIQQAFNRFVIFSLAGVMYNLGIIFGIIFFAPHLGIYGVAWGVVLGVILQAILQWLGLYGIGFKYRPSISVRATGVRETLRLMVPRSIDQGIDQINYSVETIIGSTISQSAIAQFSLANNLKNVPLVLIGSSISTAVFPRLAARAAAGARQQLIEGYVKTARLILFLSIPSAIFAVLARGYIVRLLYGFGDAATANTLGWFAGTIVFSGLFMLVSRVFFAMQDTKTPLYTSLGSIPLNILLSFVLAHKYGVVGLAMAASIVAALETTLLSIILRLREGNFGEGQIVRGGTYMAIAGLVMTVAVHLLIKQVFPLYAGERGFLVLIPKFLIIVLIATVTYLVPCYLMRLVEAKYFVGRLREMMMKSFNLT